MPALLLILLFIAAVVVPVTLYLYWVHSAWSWLYVLDPADIPDLAIVPVLVLQGGVLFGGWYLGANLAQMSKIRPLSYSAAGAAAAFFLALLLTGGRLGHYGSYEAFRSGTARGLMEVKLGYVLITLCVGIGAAVGFVAVELIRDSRRVRAR